ncbi:Uroporphyrinogen III synthase/methyltransferase [Candidatus Sulfobium mesophilum]|uniref:uroporphyrinogen-III C-methyltransferase n=1 Tax=Candidatus Sulfobium mesophilum TaxID=2016548 RepID=A0A2U3QGU5_9BACT|nr:Uroporphyrinogen III synthase/methyltransferase [Candidatus Sulfobium mesophilum]
MSHGKGIVYLVGAGPGDIGLLTVKGLKCLQKAEVVIYDFHLNAQILNYISRDAEFIYAGKRGGHHTMTQDEINAEIVAKAKKGKTVCRLKGGDPFVFGRGGEEAQVLAKEGIRFEVVPGVSSSVAAPAYAGIPLTHRLYSSSFAVIPGYEDTTKEESAIDWSKLATGVGTLVFLMAVKNISVLTQKLIENGRDPDTPVAVIRWGTRPDQRTLQGSLKDIADLVREKDIRPPAVMVVGDVVNLRQELKWYELKPMFGHRILVTREHMEGFGELEELGAELVLFSTVEIVPPVSWDELDSCIEKIGSYEWVIFTSANGVKYFFSRLFEKGIDIRELKGIRICAIGTKTAARIRKFGLKVDLIPEEFRAEGLIEAFTKESRRQQAEGRSRESAKNIPPSASNLEPRTSNRLDGVRFLLPRAEVAREIFPEKVRELGGVIDVPVTYRAVKPEYHGKRLRRFLKEGRVTIATFTSAATFNNFREIMGEDADELLGKVAIAVIGPVTAKAVEKAGLKVEIMPALATVEAMAEEIKKWAGRNASN